MMTPSSILFTSTLTLGTMVAVSSSSWIYTWAGLELNLLSMVPIMVAGHHLQETESAIKYFLVQTIGSAVLLLSTSMLYTPLITESMKPLTSLVVISSILMKLGAAPTHWWLPAVMAGISWTQCMIISTWQKLAPLMILTMFMTSWLSVFLMSAAAMMSTLIGGLGGINQSQLRALLAFSSIGHLGWMIMAGLVSPSTMWAYFIMYSTMNIAVMYVMKMMFQLGAMTTNAIIYLQSTKFWLMMIMLLSLGGMPPLLGFVAKWIVVSSLSKLGMIMIMGALIMGSLMNLFYYLNMMFNYMMTPKPHLPQNSPSTPPTLLTAFFISTMTPIAFI